MFCTANMCCVSLYILGYSYLCEGGPGVGEGGGSGAGGADLVF